ncbi:MAG: PLP-dependent aminotransferase family protein [Pelolinea sp.]|nr:PLP-dependent aminotransferase family protein [Pelolinea sp.]
MKDLIAFTRGVPPVETFPNQQLIECAERVISKRGDDILQYGSAAGYGPLREYLAQKYAVEVDRLVIGQGSLELLDLLCRVSLEAGDSVFVEQPTYDRPLVIFRRAQPDFRGFNLCDGQIDIEAVKTILENGTIPKYFYVIPDFQNPNGSVMGLDQRLVLIELAKKYRFLIIEDNPYRHLRYEGTALPSLFELSSDDVIHMSSFSKLLSPGLRIGFMILPKDLSKKMIDFANDTYICPSFLGQAVAVDFFEQGTLDQHIGKLINLYRSRLQALLSALDKHLKGYGEWVRPQGGFFVGLHLSDHIAPIDPELAAKYGLAFSDGRGFFLNGGSRFVRLPFCALTEDQNKQGIERLGEVISASNKD